ncbi:MAG: UMP kinase [Deltaproteobacteria bacterium]|nr:UMP kinase [Deltaproteobacteria bacterium]
MKYRRILLKLSGEALMGSNAFGVHADTVEHLSKEVASVHALGVEIGIVLGGGNFFRGISEVGKRFDRSIADQVGMLATVMNCLVFQDGLEREGLDTRVLTALEMPKVAEPFIRRRAVRHLGRGRIVLFAAGTGHPYFSTDTGAALRALEINAEAIIKGTKVDGIYDSDPETNPDAVRYDRVTYQEVMEKNLRVMDQTAVALCRENGIPLHVLSIRQPDRIVDLLHGKSVGTLVTESV